MSVSSRALGGCGGVRVIVVCLLSLAAVGGCVRPEPSATPEPVELPVADTTPAVAWESSGIRLDCAWNPTSKYEVQGKVGQMQFTSPTYVNPTIIRRAVGEDWNPDSSLPLALGDALTRSNWGRDAKLRVSQVSSDDEVDVAAVERILRAEALELEACAEQRAWFVGKQRLRVELRFAAQARLLDARLLDGSLGVDADACVTAVLRSASWAATGAADAVVTVELALLK